MTMASFLRGKPIMEDYTPASAYAAGDVIVINNLPCVAHEANPYDGSTTNLVKDALAVSGGIYQITSDSAYGPGTSVFWDTGLQKVTTIQGANAFHFGWVVGGANDLLSDGSGTTVSVLHAPVGAIQPVPSSVFDNPRNLIDGGDFTTNPFQRGTSQAADITNSATYGPDRFFFIGGASSAINWSQNADTSVVGFGDNLKFQRKAANADLTALKMGQVLETLDCIRTQGQTVTLSFWAKKGANYSGGALSVDLNHSTTAGNDTAAHLAAASTNWQATPTIIHTTQALTTSYVRYQFTGVVPAGATQLGVLFTWTPTGTAGADDSISFLGIQLEVGNGATPFEHRDVELELALCQRYFFQLNEVNGLNVAVGAPTGTNTQGYSFWLPTPMRVAPTVNVTIGGLKVIIDGGAAAAVVGLAAGTAHSNSVISLVSTNTLSAAVHSILLQGSAATGIISATADL